MQASKTISASQVKNNFGAIVNQVSRGKYPEVIVENRGQPVVAIIPIDDLKSVKDERDRAKRMEALERIRQLRAKVQARIKGKLSQKQAEKIASRFSSELIEDMAKEGKLKFERKTP